MDGCIGIIFESQEGIGQSSNWVADGLEGKGKFGLVWGSGGPVSVHEGEDVIILA